MGYLIYVQPTRNLPQHEPPWSWYTFLEFYSLRLVALMTTLALRHHYNAPDSSRHGKNTRQPGDQHFKMHIPWPPLGLLFGVTEKWNSHHLLSTISLVSQDRKAGSTSMPQHIIT